VFRVLSEAMNCRGSVLKITCSISVPGGGKKLLVFGLRVLSFGPACSRPRRVPLVWLLRKIQSLSEQVVPDRLEDHTKALRPSHGLVESGPMLIHARLCLQRIGTRCDYITFAASAKALGHSTFNSSWQLFR
jgi:hypothetical protein